MQDIIDRLERVLARMNYRNAELDKALKHKPIAEMNVLELIELVENYEPEMVR